MSLFGSMMGDFDDDLFMGNHMNAMNMQMRSMNRLMNSLMPDPFNMLSPFDAGMQQNAMMERIQPGPMGGFFGFPPMPNMNRLLSADIGAPNGASYCSSSVISMSSGPDGRPQIYQATSSTKTGPGGVRETRKTVQDSTKGLKKMAIGHHIGERGHVIEKEQDLRSGQLEERQEFINLEEEQAEEFDREFTHKIRRGAPHGREMLSIEPLDDDEKPMPRRQLPALPAPPQHHNSSTMYSQCAEANAPDNGISNTINANNNNNNLNASHRRNYRNLVAMPRRPLRTPTSSPLATTPTHHNHINATSSSVHPHPYNASAARRNHRSKHTKHQQQQQQLQSQSDLGATAAAPPITNTIATNNDSNN